MQSLPPETVVLNSQKLRSRFERNLLMAALNELEGSKEKLDQMCAIITSFRFFPLDDPVNVQLIKPLVFLQVTINIPVNILVCIFKQIRMYIQQKLIVQNAQKPSIRTNLEAIYTPFFSILLYDFISYYIRQILAKHQSQFDFSLTLIRLQLYTGLRCIYKFKYTHIRFRNFR